MARPGRPSPEYELALRPGWQGLAAAVLLRALADAGTRSGADVMAWVESDACAVWCERAERDVAEFRAEVAARLEAKGRRIRRRGPVGWGNRAWEKRRKAGQSAELPTQGGRAGSPGIMAEPRG